MRARAFRPFLPLAILPLTLAQSISFSVKGSSCVIIGQFSASSSPNTLERSTPLCPSETRDISWPLSSSGEGGNSHFGLYANIQDGRPGCVVGLGPDQVGYLVGRQLEWREQEGLLFDVAANGEVLNTNTWEPIMWRVFVLAALASLPPATLQALQVSPLSQAEVILCATFRPPLYARCSSRPHFCSHFLPVLA